MWDVKETVRYESGTGMGPRLRMVRCSRLVLGSGSRPLTQRRLFLGPAALFLTDCHRAIALSSAEKDSANSRASGVSRLYQQFEKRDHRQPCAFRRARTSSDGLSANLSSTPPLSALRLIDTWPSTDAAVAAAPSDAVGIAFSIDSFYRLSSQDGLCLQTDQPLVCVCPRFR
jgi:hypothetical protein